MDARKEKGKTNPIVIVSAVFGTGLGIVVAWLVYATLTGRQVPVVSGDRQVFIALAIIGFVMCGTSFPIRASLASWWSWLSPFTVTSIVLGGLALLLVILTLIGKPLPLISGDRQAIITLASIIFLKWSVATVHLFVR